MEIYGYRLTFYYIFNCDCPLEIGSVHHWELLESSRLLGLQALAAKIVFTKSPRQTTWEQTWTTREFSSKHAIKDQCWSADYKKLDCFHHSIVSSFKGPGEEGGNFEATLQRCHGKHGPLPWWFAKHVPNIQHLEDMNDFWSLSLDPCFHLSETRGVLYRWYWIPTYQVRYECQAPWTAPDRTDGAVRGTISPKETFRADAKLSISCA